MKTKITQFRKLTILCFTLVAVVFLSCSSDDDSQSGNSNYYLKAKINGTNYNTQGEVYCTYTNIFGIVAITGTNVNGTELFTITSMNGLEIGTYQASASNPFSLTFQYVANEGNYTSTETNEGWLEITSFDETTKTLKGKFAFKAKQLQGEEIKNITEGEFSCKGLN